MIMKNVRIMAIILFTCFSGLIPMAAGATEDATILETEMEETESRNDEITGNPLMEDDFIIYTEPAMEYLEPYENNYYKCLCEEVGEGQGYFYYTDEDANEDVNEDDPSYLESVETYRNIILAESTMDDVLIAYGYGKAYAFTEDDFMYYVCTYYEDEMAAENMINNCVNYISYDYEDKGQIVFYFNKDEIVIMIAYTSYIYAENYYRETETIIEVQEALNSAGYNCGTADGIAGSATQAAIEQYQEDNGLEVTGRIDSILVTSLIGSGTEEDIGE